MTDNNGGNERTCKNCGKYMSECSGGEALGCWISTPETKEQRQLACIKLGVPRTGDKWLDELIAKSRRERLAGQALAGSDWRDVHDKQKLIKDGKFELYAKDMACRCVQIADALAAELDKSEGGGDG